MSVVREKDAGAAQVSQLGGERRRRLCSGASPSAAGHQAQAVCAERNHHSPCFLPSVTGPCHHSTSSEGVVAMGTGVGADCIIGGCMAALGEETPDPCVARPMSAIPAFSRLPNTPRHQLQRHQGLWAESIRRDNRERSGEGGPLILNSQGLRMFLEPSSWNLHSHRNPEVS